MNVLERLRHSFAAATPEGGDAAAFAAAVRPSTDSKFGDYQANGCMALAKSLQKNPRELAHRVAEAVDLAPLAATPEVAGPGFLNVRLVDSWVARTLEDLIVDEALGIVPPARPKTVVVDYSSPNVAKPMHVGHIRSTVIGESLARIFAALGHKVIRDNHLGDWGSQFGMILWGWKNHRDEAAFATAPVAELARLYRLAQAKIKAKEPNVEDATRVETAKLHAGDAENRALWERFMPYCLAALKDVYDRLGVKFDVELGESFYDPMLADVVADLEAKGIAQVSEGATVVFVEGTKAPLIVRKRDGAYNYATTDLATIKYREETWQPDEVLYVVDHRQGDHFKLLFAVARRWGYERTDLEHVAFGTILGTDRKPFKTRDGDVVGLESLLDEGVAEALKVVQEISPDLEPEQHQRVAEVVGLGSIKYADLSQNRQSDYVFDWKKMLAMNGNTGAYLQYAYARIQSIFRKGEITPESIRLQRPTIALSHPAERALGVRLLRLPETLELAALELKPNILTDYLFDLANAFSSFFEECPVLKAESTERRNSRLALADITARTLKFGLDLLGIEVVDRM
ncbi:arginine--tRNA ligase [Singulisphaera acidiphila]|uniref:Arginine--tRNA ligase n=1 Tax=Singulisphaera acidiphila (strain ATCC BAA-1392 / DSM 18658 / VKM B-2454 / MOB10) TaxID=886293 RepID=L0DKC6_SINAD|nr:arginine--tRNA ligase [Singulisphaera acidiphila]AGA29106.1 arginyl-tRNA synthetase [Singulisphaera acidiphila DSM 18658]